MLDTEKEGVENREFILKIKSLLDLPNVKQNISLKDLYTFDISKKIYELMASGFTIDVDPNISEKMDVWGVFRYLNVVHSKKDNAKFLVVEGFKPERGDYFDEPFTYICGLYQNLNDTVRVDYFIEKEGLSSNSYAVMISLNDEEVPVKLEGDNLFFIQCAYKLLEDLKDSTPDDESTMRDFKTQFPSLNRKWFSEINADKIDSKPYIM